MLDTDKIIEEFRKTRYDKDENKVLKKFPCMLGELIIYAIKYRDFAKAEETAP